MGRHRRRLPELERQARRLLPPHRRHPRRVGHRGQRPGHGLRQHGRRLRHRRRLHPQPGHRREQVLRRVAASTPRARTWSPASAPRPRSTRPPRPSTTSDLPQPRKGHARDLQASSTPSRRRSRSTTTTCWTSSSPSRRASCGCCSAASASATAPPPCAWPWTWCKEKLIDAGRGRHARHPGPARRAAAPDHRPEGREGREADLAKGLPAGPGGAAGQVVFTADDAVEWAKQGKKVILVREETNPGGRRRHARGRRHPHRPRRHDLATRRSWPAAGASAASSAAGDLHVDVAKQDDHGRAAPIVQGRRLDHPERHQGQRLRRPAAADRRRRGEPRLRWPS